MWANTGLLATGRHRHTATVLASGAVLITGGRTAAESAANTAESYDPASGTWTTSGSLAAARYAHTATALENGQVLIAGGTSAQGKRNSAELSNFGANEGSPATQAGTFSDPNGNGTVALTASAGTITQDNAAGTWSWTAVGADGPASSTVTITATDPSSVTATASFAFTVVNVAPTVSGTATLGVDTAVSFSFTVTDPSSTDQAAGFAWAIDYGDGSAVQSVTAGTASPLARAHTFPQPGTYSVRAMATDKDGAAGTVTVTVTIDAAPVNGAAVPGGGTFAAFGTPQAGAFAGTVQVGTKKSAAIFVADGRVLLKVGGTVGGLTIAKLGAPSGDAVLVTLKVGGAITAKNCVQLVTGLSTGSLAVGAQTGTAHPGLPAGVTIKTFIAIDGAGRTPFVLGTLQGTGVIAANNSALLAIRGGGQVTIAARTGDTATLGATTRTISILATLVGSKGTLAANRWRVDDDTFGMRATFGDKSQASFAVPATAATPADWQPTAQTGVFSGGPLAGITATSFGLPGFGNIGSAQLVNLKTTLGSVTSAITSDTAVLARNDTAAPDATGNALPGVLFKTLADPLSGANGAVAFAGTLAGTGVEATNRSGLWFAANGATAKLLARAGDPAPDGGHWKAFSTMVLPDHSALGPIFLATLATSIADGVTARNNLGLYATDSTGTVRLLLRTGGNASVNGVSKVVETFTALVPSVGSIGAASGYDNAGNVAVLATFGDGSQALLVLTVP